MWISSIRFLFLCGVFWWGVIPGLVWGEHSALQLAQQREYTRLIQEIQSMDAASLAYRRLQQETYRPEALILSTDTCPADVTLRRTRALAAHLETLPGGPDLGTEKYELDQVAQQLAQADADPERLFFELCGIRRRVAFKNPLLDFNRILFLKHHKQARGEIHMIDQYFGFNARPGGGVFVLEDPFGAQARATNLLGGKPVTSGRLAGQTLDQGSFIALDLDYDAQTLAFAWTEAQWQLPDDADWSTQHWSEEECKHRPRGYHHYFWRPESTYHVFSAALDGSSLAQLTDGPWNEYDPCFLPDGDLVFISERHNSNVRCGARWCPSANLFRLRQDTSAWVPLSYHETNEWHPSVDNDGMLVYTRWDYVDRDNDAAHHLWTCYPDGRDPRAPHGNYTDCRETRPWMELAIRAIPGSRKYLATAAPHHGENYGSLILIDTSQPDDGNMSQVKRITPEAHFPEAEMAPGVPHPKGKHHPKGEVFGTPWPLDEDFYLGVYDPDQKQYGLYLVDSFGNREWLYDDPEIPCLDPMPLQSRPRPPVLEPRYDLYARAEGRPTPETGRVAVMNVYDSKRPLPDGEQVAALRVVQFFPKDNAYLNVPEIGIATESLARGVLGTVPVEADGSAYFDVPAGVEICFQALDKQGRAIQTMRTGTYLHPGEEMTCAGCHEPKASAPGPTSHAIPLALQRAPSRLQPGPPGSYPITFPRLVQPVLDRHCVSCHQPGGDRPSLTAARVAVPESPEGMNKISRPHQLNGLRHLRHGWSDGYAGLRSLAWGMSGGNGIIAQQVQYSIPGQVGARASRLLALLETGHYKVTLSQEERQRIITWIDCNSVFYGAYHDPERQGTGEQIPPKLGFLAQYAR